MSKHTPGPWGIERTATENWIGPLRDDGKVLHIVAHIERGSHLLRAASDRNDANADLIAAAPDLLAACKRAIQEFVGAMYDERGNPYDGAIEAMALLELARAKAEPPKMVCPDCFYEVQRRRGGE